MKKIFQSLINLLTRVFNYALHLLYIQFYRKQIKRCKLSEAQLPKSRNELKREYNAKWGKLSSNINFNEVLYFARYIGYNNNIITESVCHNCIEPVLNPIRFRAYYQDKNIYEMIFPKSYLAKAFLSKRGGFYYDNGSLLKELSDDCLSDKLKDVNKILIKPTIDSASGRGITVWERQDNAQEFVLVNSKENVSLDVNYLQTNYGKDFAIQEFLKQSPAISRFNKSSVNTLRLATYRSVVDDSVHVLNAIIRIGGENSVVDNAHAGGVFVGLFPDGTLGKYTCNQYGEVGTTHNGVDFSTENCVIPNYDKVMDFAKDVAKKVLHHRLLALDIMLDENDEPKLIEFNNNSWSTWLFQYTTSASLGKHTDEIIEYCAANKDQAEKIIFSI